MPALDVVQQQLEEEARRRALMEMADGMEVSAVPAEATLGASDDIAALAPASSRAAMARGAPQAPEAVADPYGDALDEASRRRFAHAGGDLGRGIIKAFTGVSDDSGKADREAFEQAPVVAFLQRQKMADKKRALDLTAQKAIPKAGRSGKSTDPTSPESKLAQARVRAVLAGQLTDEDISNVTEDSETSVMKYGSLGRRDEVTREGQLATTQRAQATLEQSAQQFAAREGREWAKLSQDERQFYLRMAHDTEMEALKSENKTKEGLEGDVANAGKDLEDIGGMKTDLETLVSASKQPDIPGAGIYDSQKPAFLQSKADTKTIQAARGIVGRLIKAQSGSAASEQEVTRKMEELGILGGTEQQFTIGLTRLTEDARHVMENRQAKWRPEVLGRYRLRGGIVAGDLPSTKPKRTPPTVSPAPAPSTETTEEMVPMVAPDGRRRRVPRSKVDAALKAGGRLANG
jgi:hypothetical protein